MWIRSNFISQLQNPASCSLVQGPANISCKGPGSKEFRFWGPHHLCQNCPSLLSPHETHQTHMLAGVALPPSNFIVTDIWTSRNFHGSQNVLLLISFFSIYKCKHQQMLAPSSRKNRWWAKCGPPMVPLS